MLRGDLASRGFSIIHLRANRVAALDCVNAVRDYAKGNGLVTDGVQLLAEQLAHVSTSLKDLPAVASTTAQAANLMNQR